MKIHLTSLFRRLLRKDESFSISRSSRAYSFFKNEYPNQFPTDQHGNLIIGNESETIRTINDHFTRVVGVGSNVYGYFLNEYRQNSPVRDIYGNIILSDDLARTMHR